MTDTRPAGVRFVLVGDNFPAAQALDVLLKSPGCAVSAVFTDTSAPSSGMVVQKARGSDIAVHDAGELRATDAGAMVGSLNADWLINVNSTVLLPDGVLDAVSKGALNMHPGLLPEYGGLHTHQWAIMNGEETFGATVHYIVGKIDAGDIVKRVEVPVGPEETGLSLFMKCVRAGSDAMAEIVADIAGGATPKGYAQDLSRRHLYRLRDLPSGEVDWRDDAIKIERMARSSNYEPFESPSFTTHFKAPDGTMVDLLKGEVVPPSDDRAHPPGEIFYDGGDGLPVVTCGDGAGLKIVRARERGDKSLLDKDALRSLIPEGSALTFSS